MLNHVAAIVPWARFRAREHDRERVLADIPLSSPERLI